ncbi:NUDIX hydrolase [Lacticaseibacillus kribbianus]|uniref:NUDIX hydrolase n=1 Tax=Lacticaseibacillus kribbianus TaxID=2926292 RepID=UPI001CD79E20|nr:NUDIX domain-containing protein [Lacticaseibacillus kribbianus]
MQDADVKQAFLDYLTHVYDKCNDHLLEQGHKRDQVIAFYIVLLSFVVTYGRQLAGEANMMVIDLGLVVVGWICVRLIADLRSWHKQYLDCIEIINWAMAHQQFFDTVTALKTAIQALVKSERGHGPDQLAARNAKQSGGESAPEAAVGVAAGTARQAQNPRLRWPSLSTDDAVYYGVLLMTVLPVLFTTHDLLTQLGPWAGWVTAAVVGVYAVLGYVVARRYLKRVTHNGLTYLTWILDFDYAGNTLTYNNRYMTVSVEGERLHVTQKTGGVVIVAQYEGRFVLLTSQRGERELLEFPRGFRERGESGVMAAARELQEEVQVPRKPYTGAPTLPNAAVSDLIDLGELIPDSGLITSDVRVVAATLHLAPQPHRTHYEGIDGVTLVDEAQLAALISDNDIKDGFTLGAWSLYRAQRQNR